MKRTCCEVRTCEKFKPLVGGVTMYRTIYVVLGLWVEVGTQFSAQIWWVGLFDSLDFGYEPVLING